MDIDFHEMREDGFFSRIDETREADKKRVDTHGGWTNVPACPICKKPTTKASKRRFSLLDINSYVCDTCHCVYNDKIPKQSNVGEYNLQTVEQVVESPDEKKYEYRKKRFGEERISILKKYVNPKLSLKDARLLDVGCNTGFFLDVAKQYCDHVEGLETAKVIAKYASKKLGVPVYTDDLFSFKPAYTYDIITLFDVIEHISNPLEFLQKTKQLLSKKGIVLLFTPNYKALSFDILNERSNLYFPSDHLLFFCKETVEYVAKKLDMNVLMCETRGMDFFDMFAFERDINGIDISESILLKNINMIQNALDNAGYANHMRFILQKKE